MRRGNAQVLRSDRCVVVSRDLVLQAIARGYCSQENFHKETDATLCEAMADEVMAALRSEIGEQERYCGPCNWSGKSASNRCPKCEAYLSLAPVSAIAPPEPKDHCSRRLSCAPFNCEYPRCRYEDVEAPRSSSAEPKALRAVLTSLSKNQCYACGWSLAKEMEDGCVPFNCSFRPSESHPEHAKWLVMAKDMAEVLAFASTPRSASADTEELERLRGLLNTPEIDSFLRAVHLEAVHQVERWGTTDDRAKRPADWFWLIGYLAGKALHSQVGGNAEKALHHCISTAAALYNWHCAIKGVDVRMCPGSSDVERIVEAAFPGTAMDRTSQ